VFIKTKTPLACHPERIEESRVLNGRIMFKSRKNCHSSYLPPPSSDSSSPKSSFRMTNKGEWFVKNDKKHPWLVILNKVKNPAYSMGESYMKAEKTVTTHTFNHAVGILPRPKACSEW